jgi:low affinity Fe/Cu permease
VVGKKRPVDAVDQRPRLSGGAEGDDLPTSGSRSSRSPRHPEKEWPSEVSEEVDLFDRFAGGASRVASRAPFFAFCLLLVLVWAPTIFVLKNVDTWQLIINTVTTIVTFLMVALLQNSQYRTDEATQHKLNAIAQGLADLMDHAVRESDDGAELAQDIRELQRAVGLEQHESSV